MDYKSYSLDQLETWIYDTLDGDVSADEIYNLICKIADENYQHHKKYADKSRRLTELMQSNNKICMDKVKRWILPVEEVKDEDTDENIYCVTFPDDLLEAADLKEGDLVEWIDNGDGSFKMVKVNATN